MARIFRSSFRACVLIALIFSSSSIYAQGLVAIINTSKGVIEAELNDRAAPTTVANFINLAIRGFYDGLIFHRVERNFMVQGGDPLGNGSGGPGYRFAGEIILKHNQPGILSMANSGVLASSRFPFAMAKDKLMPDYLGKISSKFLTVNLSSHMNWSSSIRERDVIFERSLCSVNSK